MKVVVWSLLGQRSGLISDSFPLPGYILHHNRPGADHRALPDRDARKDNGVRTDPGPISNPNEPTEHNSRRKVDCAPDMTLVLDYSGRVHDAFSAHHSIGIHHSGRQNAGAVPNLCRLTDSCRRMNEHPRRKFAELVEDAL